MKKQNCGAWLSGVAFIGLSPLIIVAGQTAASAACPIPDSVSDQPTVIASFLNSECTKQTLTQETIYYRYYNSDDTYRFGRYLTSNFYDSSNGKTTLDVIQELALAQYFGPPPNLAQLRGTVTLPPGLDVYIGIAGAQPPNVCYPGGGTQAFIENTRTPGISFVFDGNVPDGGSLSANCYSATAAKPIPESSPLFAIGVLATIGLAATFNRILMESKTKQIANSYYSSPKSFVKN